MKKRLTVAQKKKRTQLHIEQHLEQKERIKALLDKERMEIHLRTNIAYLMCDVAGSEIMKLEPMMKRLGQQLKREEKVKFNNLSSAVKILKVRSDDVAKNIYKIDEAEHACSDSDFFQNIIELIVDRFSDDDPELQSFVGDLRNRKSKMGIFDERG